MRPIEIKILIFCTHFIAYVLGVATTAFFIHIFQ